VTAPKSKSVTAPQPEAAARREDSGVRVVCDNCGAANAAGTKYCFQCNTTLAPSRASELAITPARPRSLSELARAKASSDANAAQQAPVSPYAATIPQEAYVGPGASELKKKRASTDAAAELASMHSPGAAPTSAATRWLVAAVIIVLVVVAAVVYLLVR
jgi:hypothetical protein